MNTHAENTTLFTPFWPLCLLALSLTVFLGWQVATATQQYFDFLRFAEQQDVVAAQAAQAENKLQAMMMDLLKLSKTDADARAIVSEYGIKFNPAPAPVPAVLPVVDAVLPPAKSPRAPRDAAAGSGTWTGDDAPRKPVK